MVLLWFFFLLWFCLLLSASSSSSFQGVEFLHFWSFQLSFKCIPMVRVRYGALVSYNIQTGHFFSSFNVSAIGCDNYLRIQSVAFYGPCECVCYCVSFWRVWNEFDFGKIIINKYEMIYGAVCSFSPWNMNLFEWKGVCLKTSEKKSVRLYIMEMD